MKAGAGLRLAMLYMIAFTFPVVGFAVLVGRVSTAISQPAAVGLTAPWWSTWQMWGLAFLITGLLALLAALVRSVRLVNIAYTTTLFILVVRSLLLFSGLFAGTAGLPERAQAVLGSTPWWLAACAVFAIHAFARD